MLRTKNKLHTYIQTRKKILVKHKLSLNDLQHCLKEIFDSYPFLYNQVLSSRLLFEYVFYSCEFTKVSNIRIKAFWYIKTINKNVYIEVQKKC